MRPKLEVRHLLTLNAVAETGTVTQAAERLGVTQSALTHRIREAERRLDTQLFKKVGRRVFLTPAGERLQAAAVRVIDEISRAEEEIRTQNGVSRSVVRLGQGTYSRYHWLPEFMAKLAHHAPDIEIDLVARAVYQPFLALQEGAADLVVVHGSERRAPQFRWYRFSPDPLVAIMAPDHPLARKSFVVAEDFVDERYITYSLMPELGLEWHTIMRPSSIQPRRLSVVQVPEAIIDLVRAGFGVSILSRWAVEPEIADGTLIAKPITPDGVTVNWWGVIRAAEEENSPAQRVVEAMVAWGKRDDGGLGTLGFRGETK